MADQMVELARQQDGFLGVESARNEIGITGFLLARSGIDPEMAQ